MKRMLFLSLPALSRLAEQEIAVVGAIDDLGEAFDEVLVMGPPVTRFTYLGDALDYKRACDRVKEAGLDLFVGRRLPDWGDVGTYDDLFRPDYWTHLFTTLMVEQRALGAVGTAVDLEPYGDSPMKRWKIPGALLSQQDFYRLQLALWEVWWDTYPHLFIPSGSNTSERHYNMALRLAMQHRSTPIENKTYTLKDASVRIPWPREMMQPVVRAWASHVSLDGHGNTLTPDEAVAVWQRVPEFHPQCERVVCYSDIVDTVGVMRAFTEIAEQRGTP